ncbi:Uncharacterized membrane protein [Saccharicrinis carchari]|uniref:Uncharacterized membrane protein n=1 Tax=Saccharicrinis carchari TaxID=1168039 RepID=A0A521ACL6_SACCC|nr:DUF1772 domain-containing protein [Saccharicrinis carchari]SMO32430.1 Uncharacterized membrane protein [Saccharicrinis carchari]
MATLFTGLSAGLCFTWANVVTPGIARLNDMAYLQAFRQMNKAILNPPFIVVFFGAIFLIIATTILHWALPSYMVWMLIGALVLYFVGVVLVTIFGNVPLNEMLDKTDLSELSLDGAKSLRDRFEDSWNKLHLVRTVTAIISFSLLLLTCVTKAV